MKEVKLSYEEICKFVNHLDDEEFNLLREAVYERILDDIREDKINETEKTYEKKPRFLWEE